LKIGNHNLVNAGTGCCRSQLRVGGWIDLLLGRTPRLDKLSENGPAPLKWMSQAKHRLGNRASFRSGQTNDTHAPSTCGCGDGDNRVVQVHPPSFQFPVTTCKLAEERIPTGATEE
jgi:hypothetical protein